jgi:hypothetical protein
VTFLGVAVYGSASPDHVRTIPLAAAPASAVTSEEPANQESAIQESARPPEANLDFAVDVHRRSRFVWPASGDITSWFGPGHPLGIDIGLDPSEDSPIRASAVGTVTFAGGDRCCDYGLHVDIDHGNGVSTLYGHLSEIRVLTGDRVEQGALIGLGGSTGVATGKHLHFELSVADQLVDPLRYLPVSQALTAPSDQVAKCGSDIISGDPASNVQLTLRPSSLAGFEIATMSISAPRRPGYPPFTYEVRGREVVLSVPPPPVALGETIDFNVDVILHKENEEQTVGCQLRLRTNQTFANPIETVTDFKVRHTPPMPTFTPTATPTKTPIPWPTPKPPATPTRR